MSGYVLEAPPQSRASIRKTAELVRRLAERRLGATGPYLPIMDVIEAWLPTVDEDFELQIGYIDDMGDNHGLTVPGQHLIRLREDVYDGACAGRGRDRGTAAHELGHYILHHDLNLPRRLKESELKSYRSSEWQAKCFAGELLVSAAFVLPTDDAASIAYRFGVSMDAAAYQFKQLKKGGII